jgi:hypothetical protein
VKALARPSFAAVAWAVGGPLLLWAGHFAFCYVAVAVGCAGMARGAAWSLAEVRGVLLAGSFLALVAGSWWLARACAGWRRAALREGRALTPAREKAALPAGRAIAALLAWVGMLGTAVPLLLLPPCT